MPLCALFQQYYIISSEPPIRVKVRVRIKVRVRVKVKVRVRVSDTLTLTVRIRVRLKVRVKVRVRAVLSTIPKIFCHPPISPYPHTHIPSKPAISGPVTTAALFLAVIRSQS